MSSRYYEKICRFNEKRSRFNEKRSRYKDIIEWKKYYVWAVLHHRNFTLKIFENILCQTKCKCKCKCIFTYLSDLNYF